jgi:hypothetical protein
VSLKGKGIFDFHDFRGGYFTDVPSEKMRDNELLTAENCYWRNGLTKRFGKASYCSVSGATFRGGIRAYVKSAWYTFIGVEGTGSAMSVLEYGTDTAFTTLTNGLGSWATFMAGYNMQFAYLDGMVGIANGYDKPMLLRASGSAVFVDTIEKYDTRAMDHDDWYAGPWNASTPTTFTDDTADAQSSASTDFQLATSTITAGFWVACGNTFNKITLYDCRAQATASLTFEYFGQADSTSSVTWNSFTPVSAPTWTAIGDKTIEMNFPIDSITNDILVQPYPSSSYNIAGRYAMRFRSGGTLTSATWACGEVKVEHTQYLTQILLNDRPDTIAAHKSHIFIGMGNWIRRAPMNSWKGWRESDKEYFSEGGLIKAMVPHVDYLAILQENAIHGVYGNSWSDFATRFLQNWGTVNKRTAVVVGDMLFFVSHDGIYGWNGSALMQLTKHIQSDFDALTLTDACAVNNRGEYWVSFPTNGTTLIFDPDMFRQDDMGNGRMSFYKFTGYKVHQFLPYTGTGDNGRLMALVSDTTKLRLDQCETGTSDLLTGTTATISMRAMTRYLDFENNQSTKVFRRIRPLVANVSITAGMNYLVKLYKRDKYGGASVSTFITSSVTTGEYTDLVGSPPGFDGTAFALLIGHDGQCGAKFMGFALQAEGRPF